MYKLLLATAAGSLLWSSLAVVLLGPGLPRSIYGMEIVLCFVVVAGARFLVRFYYESRGLLKRQRDRKRVLIYGARTAGYTLLKELRGNASRGCYVVGFIDDDPHKRGQNLLGAPVLTSGRKRAGGCGAKFMTPIAYPSSLLAGKWRIVYGVNPVAGVVGGFPL